MSARDLIGRDMTDAIRGISAIGIFVFHIILAYAPSPLTNFWGGMFVAVFLILSGYGVNESHKRSGLDGYWRRRWNRVILPTVVFACLFNFVSPDGNLKTLLAELSYSKPTYWFVFHILRCYAVYWVSMRFFKRRAIWVMCAFAVFCLNHNFCGVHLESEQAFSFLSGVLISRSKDKIAALSHKTYWKICILLFVIGLMFFLTKLIPAIYAHKGTVLYNYIQCPFRLTWGVSLLMLLLKCDWLQRARPLRWVGKYSLELYVSHIPLLVYLTGDVHTLPLFLAMATLSFAVLVMLDKHVLPGMTVPVAVYIIVNALFVAKYSARVIPCGFKALTLATMLFHYLLLVDILPRFRSAKAYVPAIIVGLLGICTMVCLQYTIDPYDIRVDRWSALHNPIANLLAGKYPYLASTHLGGYASPFPVWQFFHVPFYLLGNVGLSFFMVSALFFYSIYRFQGGRALSIALLLTTFSPAIWYEVAVRSDLITNMLLVATGVNFVIHKISVQWLQRHTVSVAVVIGLLACTRIVSLLPIAILLFPYYIKSDLKRQVMLPLCFVVTFVLTFLPFVLWNSFEFFHFEHNPWSLQTRQGNGIDFLLFIPLGIYLSLQWRGDHINYYRNTILLLSIFVATTFIHNMVESGNYELFSSTYDITYFSTALPFCIMALIVPRRG